MKRSAAIPSPLSTINERHISRVDKSFRMVAGASPRLLEPGKTSFLPEIRIDHRVTGENASRSIRNTARSWRNGKPGLRHCITCVVCLHRSPGPAGFVLSRSADRTGIANAIDEVKRSNDLPAPLIGRFLLGFDPVEVMVRAPVRIPGSAEN